MTDAWRNGGRSLPPGMSASEAASAAAYRAASGSSAQAYPGSSLQARDAPYPGGPSMEFPAWRPEHPAQSFGPQYSQQPQSFAPYPQQHQFAPPPYAYAPVVPQGDLQQHFQQHFQQVFQHQVPQPFLEQSWGYAPPGLTPPLDFNVPWAGYGGPDVTGRSVIPPTLAPGGSLFGAYGHTDFGSAGSALPVGPAPSPFFAQPAASGSGAASPFLPPFGPDPHATVHPHAGSSKPPKAAKTPDDDEVLIPEWLFKEEPAAAAPTVSNKPTAAATDPVVPPPPVAKPVAAAVTAPPAQLINTTLPPPQKQPDPLISQPLYPGVQPLPQYGQKPSPAVEKINQMNAGKTPPAN